MYTTTTYNIGYFSFDIDKVVSNKVGYLISISLINIYMYNFKIAFETPENIIFIKYILI